MKLKAHFLDPARSSQSLAATFNDNSLLLIRDPVESARIPTMDGAAISGHGALVFQVEESMHSIRLGWHFFPGSGFRQQSPGL
jgi:hypothetical protein